MKRLAHIWCLITIPIVLSQCVSSSTEKNTTTSRWEVLAGKLMERINLQAGERVVMMGAPGEFDSLISILSSKIVAAGGEYLGTISTAGTAPDSWNTDFTTGGQQDSASLINYFSSVDLGIMMPGALPNHKPYAALQEVLKSGKGRTIHFHWSGAYNLNNEAIAITDSISQFYYDVLLNTDYDALGKLQKKFEEEAQGKRITVTDASGTNISFGITGRPVTKQDGDASKARTSVAKNLIDREIELPAGAIRVAPLEETVEGTIAFPPAVWGDQLVTGLIMTLRSGKVVDVKATKGIEAVNAEMVRGGETAKSFREFVMGFNPSLVPANKTWIPYYGYGAGIVRLSLGNNQELGGSVGGSPYVRWNFFPNTTVTVGSEVWVKDGELIRKQ